MSRDNTRENYGQETRRRGRGSKETKPPRKGRHEKISLPQKRRQRVSYEVTDAYADESAPIPQKSQPPTSSLPPLPGGTPSEEKTQSVAGSATSTTSSKRIRLKESLQSVVKYKKERKRRDKVRKVSVSRGFPLVTHTDPEHKEEMGDLIGFMQGATAQFLNPVIATCLLYTSDAADE